MIKTKLKVVLTIAILALAVLIIPGICYAEEGTNDGVVIVKTSTDRYLIYIKDYLDVDFKFALSTDGTETPSIFTNFAVDTVDAQNHIAFSETGTEEYLWVKVGDEIKISGRKIDLTDNITMAELEGIENISKTIEIEIGVSEPVETSSKTLEEVIDEVFSNTTSSDVIQNIDADNEDANRFYYSQLDVYGKLIYDKLYENKDKLKTGTYTADFGTAFDELLHEENGSETLNNSFQLAINALTFDNPDLLEKGVEE